ncbi:hypothetical protein JCM17846_04950 [Iodidimonas nitroreducens]|uniref:Uncharacterized protein n=2 Tax=Iodidimonas nitroreducens TaxID=1236968 RepID=A0A5A7N3G3_9PROT|nr:hypothetical protein JCM17846_04950 [Iodidimonas nitroreducens]
MSNPELFFEELFSELSRVHAPWWFDGGMNLGEMLLSWLIFTGLPTLALVYLAMRISFNHAKSLKQRASLPHRPRLTTMKNAPEGYGDPVLVCASYVGSHARIRSLVILFQRLIGGHIPVLERMLTRSRNEALLRLEQEMMAVKADLLINLRIQQSHIGQNNGIAITAYGTALRKTQP